MKFLSNLLLIRYCIFLGYLTFTVGSVNETKIKDHGRIMHCEKNEHVSELPDGTTENYCQSSKKLCKWETTFLKFNAFQLTCLPSFLMMGAHAESIYLIMNLKLMLILGRILTAHQLRYIKPIVKCKSIFCQISLSSISM